MLERRGRARRRMADAPRHLGSVPLADAREVSPAEVAEPLPSGELAGVAAGEARAAEGSRPGADAPGYHPGRVVRPVAVCRACAFRAGAADGGDPAGLRPETETAGTLAFLAPESTGLSCRPVDQRADLPRPAGATELATGRRRSARGPLR